MGACKRVLGGLFFVLITLSLRGNLLGASLFSENFESGVGSWVLEAPWDLTTEAAHGGTHCLTDSPGGDYGNSVNKAAKIEINLSGANRPVLSFWHRYNFQQNLDYGYVQASTDAGATWYPLFFVSGDSATQWVKEEVDLSAYAGKEILLAFRIITDAGTTGDGWYIDDLDISENTATIEFPFFDDMETSASDGNWIPSCWRRIATDGHESSHCWSTPVNNLVVANAGLVLRGTMDFSWVLNPTLSFWHHRGGAWSRVYVSGDGGHTWDLVYYTIEAIAGWRRVQVHLSAYSGLSDVLVKFVLDYGDHWNIDDVLVSDAPEMVALSPIPDADTTEHSITTRWSENPDSDFASYSIYRSYSADMANAVLVATITDQPTTTYTDSDLTFAGTLYYYQVWVLDTEGLWSEGSNVKGAQTDLGTQVHLFPFADDMETDTWGNDSPWGLTSAVSHSGAYCWTDSPVGRYENSTSRSLTTALDLSGSNRPLMSFWHRYNIEDNKDYGYVEVSADGRKTWTPVFFASGFPGLQWIKEEIDLSEYAGKQIHLRFRIVTDATGNRDGWYIDDVEVVENTATIAFPFFDDMETSESDSNWIPSSWRRIVTDGHQSSHCWSTPVNNLVVANAGLVLRGTMDFSWVLNPTLSFWHHRGGAWSRVYVSGDGGHTWDLVYYTIEAIADWRKVQVDLSAYSKKPNVAVKFVLDYGDHWNIDDVEITGQWVGPARLAVSVENGEGKLAWNPFGTGSYTVESSTDLIAWTPEAGMPIADTFFFVGQIGNLGKWRFWRVSSPVQ